MLSLTLAALIATAPTEMPVTLEAQPAALHGTLLKPEGAIEAAALIIPGSGPTDRDGNSPLGVHNGALKQLAEGLAAQGIASIRIDKRGIAASRAAGTSEAELRFETYAEDVRAWAKLATEQTGAPCVWLIGHSEGALVAQVADTGTDSNICGQVLLSGAGRPAGIVIREQLEGQLPEPLKTEVETTLSELEAGRTVANPPAALAALFRPSVQPYLVSWFKYDPAKLAHAYLGPIFIGQGSTDIQTKVTDAEALSEAQPNAVLKVWESVNHVLVQAPLDRAANLATYGNPDATIAPQVVEDVAAFIKDNTL